MDGVTHLAVPGFDIWCLSDGSHVFDADVFPSVDDETRVQRLKAAGQTVIDTVFHAYLIKPEAGGYLLLDTGCGTAFGDTAGDLQHRLVALGVEPGDIETLIFTHLHSDHCGGALDDDTPVFAKAQVIMHEREPAVWESGQYAANAVLAGYADRISLMRDGQNIAPGISAWALPGHTAGHMGLRIGDQVVLCGDILHSDALQLPDPAVCSVYDDAADQARQTRIAALDDIASRGLIFSGSHGCHMDKFRKLRRTGAGYEAVSL